MKAADDASAAGESDRVCLQEKVLAVGVDRKRPGISFPTKQPLAQAFPESWAEEAWLYDLSQTGQRQTF